MVRGQSSGFTKDIDLTSEETCAGGSGRILVPKDHRQRLSVRSHVGVVRIRVVTAVQAPVGRRMGGDTRGSPPVGGKTKSGIHPGSERPPSLYPGHMDRPGVGLCRSPLRHKAVQLRPLA
jgi:hypothetical protein